MVNPAHVSYPSVSSRNNRTNDFVRILRSAERATARHDSRNSGGQQFVVRLAVLDSWNLERRFYGDSVLILIRWGAEGGISQSASGIIEKLIQDRGGM